MAANQPPTSRGVDLSDPTFLQRLADDDARVTGYLAPGSRSLTEAINERVQAWADFWRVPFQVIACDFDSEIQDLKTGRTSLENPISDSDG